MKKYKFKTETIKILSDIHTPVELYYKLREQYVNCFLLESSEVGIDGLILPDMPLNFYLKHYKKYFKQNELKNILLITPDTLDDRIRKIDNESNSFIYMVSSNSITGLNKSLELQQLYYDRVNSLGLNNPTVIGFGIHDKLTFNVATKNSSGAIIGSAFIKHINK